MTTARPVLLYDTTLRDGMQREGLSVSVDEKVRIAVRIADLGVHIIEGGFPGSNPKDEEFFRKLEGRPLGDALVAAFGMTRGKGTTAEKDVSLRSLAECWAPVCCIVGKTWDLHVQKVLRVDRAENLRMIAESVAFLLKQGKRVHYDAEHFFDAYAVHPEYALECLQGCRRGGRRGRHPVRHQRGHAAHAGGRGGGARGLGTGRHVAGWASTPITTRDARWPTRW